MTSSRTQLQCLLNYIRKLKYKIFTVVQSCCFINLQQSIVYECSKSTRNIRPLLASHLAVSCSGGHPICITEARTLEPQRSILLHGGHTDFFFWTTLQLVQKLTGVDNRHRHNDMINIRRTGSQIFKCIFKIHQMYILSETELGSPCTRPERNSSSCVISSDIFLTISL
jgi:hypothetical protein